ncbi:GNAT family N-acetyltransferase [Mesorhizobium sp. M9A.F.Ca.ET.002.03.1.2]|uniref:GNAT family N-acetyltransferase n=1 Tax=Mesorhizobium sp. M9A.F.Ca.ET.002.03.1.2 TaxID=2493668 RepID=UPI000F75A254|nr:GNAT family N-acetyltransferase [Mesorhizobium sp. M9A.F.Ca.ET.002.03.1.2]AZO00888.1 GNAT family N-acetyltransferase [Mesorhizobium sp. M9A.F.Ca.ET.002.03.1.2]
MSTSRQTKIHQFQCSDLDSLRRLIWDTIDISYSNLYPPRAVEFFKEFHSDQNILERAQAGIVLVAEDNGEIITTGSLVDGEIFAVFVHPDRQRVGLGKALMKMLEEQARASGTSESVLSVSLPSKRFYEGLGYEIVQECSKDVGDGQRLDFWKAKKRLFPRDH